MLRTVYKYPLPGVIGADQVVSMPSIARVVHVAMQNSMPMLWADVDTDAYEVDRVFRVHGTGHPVESSWQHVGTTFDGPFVWHVFEYELF